jgi:hypothetical protein
MPGSQHPGGVPAQTTVLALPAEIDITHARRLCGEFGAALVSGATVVVADMTATTFCDSSGARIMVLAWGAGRGERHRAAPGGPVRGRPVWLCADGTGWVLAVLPQPERGADATGRTRPRRPALAGPQLTGRQDALPRALGPVFGAAIAPRARAQHAAGSPAVLGICTGEAGRGASDEALLARVKAVHGNRGCHDV